jgi:hypothetical protein
VQEKESRWLASAEGDVEAGDAEGAARGEEWLRVGWRHRERGTRGRRGRGEEWVRGTRREREQRRRQVGGRRDEPLPAPTRWWRVAEVNLGAGEQAGAGGGGRGGEELEWRSSELCLIS